MLPHIKIIRSESELAAISDEWNNLVDNNSYEFFQSFDWMFTWWQNYKIGKELFCLTYYNHENKLIFIAPLMIIVQNGKKILTFIGGGLNDYNYFIIDKNADSKFVLEEFFRTITPLFSIEFAQIDVNLVNLLEQNLLDIDFHMLGLHAVKTEDELVLAINLPNKLESYYDKIGKKTAALFEKYQKKLFGLENVSFKVKCDKNEIENFMSWFKSHKELLWHKYNKFDFLPLDIKNKNFFKFMQELTITSYKNNEIFTPCIYINQDRIAGGIYFNFKNTLFKYIQAWDYNYKNYSIGTILDWMMIKYAINNNYKLFDLGRGDEKYKYKFGAQEILINSLSVTAN